MLTRNPHQTGAVLIISLIFLLILTILGVAGIESSTLSERMAGNVRDMNVAFQAAEAALREGEERILNLDIAERDGGDAGCLATTPPCALYTIDSDIPENLATADPDWWNDNSFAFSGSVAEVATQPRFVIELAARPRANGLNEGHADRHDSYAFRITARGTGGRDTSVAVVSSTYIRRF